MSRAIRSFLDQTVKLSSFPNQPCAEGVLADLKASECRAKSLHFWRPLRSRFFDNSYTLVFKSGRSAAVLRSAVSRVSRDSLVLGAKGWVLSSLCGGPWSPMVAGAVFGQHLHTCVPKLMIRCGFDSKVDDPLRF